MNVKINVVAPTLLTLFLFAVVITLPYPANSSGLAKVGHRPGQFRLRRSHRQPECLMKRSCDHHNRHRHLQRRKKSSSTTMPMPVDLLKEKRNHAIYLNHAAKEFLDAHNDIREYFGQPPYIWNQTLVKYARSWSNRLRESCAMEHSGGPYGENLFWGSGNRWRAVDAVQNWAMERHYYDANTNSCFPGRMCGHYTQIVWRSSVMIGCARKKCRRGGVIMICNYDPPGNYVGESPFQTTTSGGPTK